MATSGVNGPFLPGTTGYYQQPVSKFHTVNGIVTPMTLQQYKATPNPITPQGSVLGASTVYGQGGGGGQPAVQTPQGTQQQQGPSAQDQLRSELDQIFSPVFNSLQGQENTLNANYASVPGDINAQFQTSANTLGQQQKSGMADLNAQATAAGTRKEDALTAASRLYNELQRGGQQRFGGTSSAGEAYQTLTATEQQRRQGSIQNAYETAMQQVGQYKTNLQDKYAIAVQDLETQKNTAINQAQRDFRDALQSISSAKAQAQSDKATAGMNALQDLRNKVYTINAQSLQFAQQLALNHDMSLKTVEEYQQRVIQSVTGGQNAVSGISPNVETNHGVSGGQQNTSVSMPTGQMASPSPGYHYDPASGQIVPD